LEISRDRTRKLSQEISCDTPANGCRFLFVFFLFAAFCSAAGERTGHAEYCCIYYGQLSAGGPRAGVGVAVRGQYCESEEEPPALLWFFPFLFSFFPFLFSFFSLLLFLLLLFCLCF
jgi:hypothetical protein